MIDIFAVNWVAVIAGTILSFILGWLWYSPKLFGQKWAEGAGVSLDQGDKMSMGPLVIQFLANFTLSWVVGITAVLNALSLVMLITLSIVLIMVAGGKFSQKSNYAITTEAGFVVAMVIVMVACQAIL